MISLIQYQKAPYSIYEMFFLSLITFLKLLKSYCISLHIYLLHILTKLKLLYNNIHAHEVVIDIIIFKKYVPS